MIARPLTRFANIDISIYSCSLLTPSVPSTFFSPFKSHINWILLFPKHGVSSSFLSMTSCITQFLLRPCPIQLFCLRRKVLRIDLPPIHFSWDTFIWYLQYRPIKINTPDVAFSSSTPSLNCLSRVTSLPHRTSPNRSAVLVDEEWDKVCLLDPASYPPSVQRWLTILGFPLMPIDGYSEC